MQEYKHDDKESVDTDILTESENHINDKLIEDEIASVSEDDNTDVDNEDVEESESKNKVDVDVECEEMASSYETKEEKEIRILTNIRNAPCDISAVKNAEKNSSTRKIPAISTIHFRLIEGLIAATSWPAAIFAVCFILIMIIAGHCSIYNVIAAIVILIAAIIGVWLKKNRKAQFSLVAETPDNKKRKRTTLKTRIKKATRRSLRAGEYGDIFTSILLGVSFVILTIFLPISIAYFLAMLLVFGIAWSLAEHYVSCAAPYCDVYDVEMQNGAVIAMISFDTPIPGEERTLVQIDDYGYLALLRESTRKFLENESDTFQLDKNNIVSRKTYVSVKTKKKSLF